MAGKVEKIFTTKGKRFMFYAIIITAVLTMVVSIMAAFSVSEFSADANRLAQEETVNTKTELFRISDNFGTLFCNTVDSQLAGYDSTADGDTSESPDSYAVLKNKFSDISRSINLDSILALDRYGHTVTSLASDYFEATLSEQIELAILRGTTFLSAFYSRASGSYSLAVYYPVAPTLTNSIRCYVGTIKFSKILSSEALTSFLGDYGAELLLVDNKSSGILYRITSDNLVGKSEEVSFKTYFSENGFKCDSYSFDDMLDSGNSYELYKGTEEFILSDFRLFDTATMDFMILFPKTELLVNSSVVFSSFVMRLGISIALMLLFIVLAIIDRVDSMKAEYTKNAVVPVIGCKTYSKFKIDAEKLIFYNRAYRYAVISFSIANSDYIQGKYGEELLVMLRKYIADGLSSMMQKNETFGYIPENRYVLLLQCETEADIKSRILIIKELINLFPAFKKRSFYGQFNIGAYYIVPGEKIDMEEFVYRSNIAMESHIKNPMRPFIMYEQKMFENFRLENEIESRMNDALENEEFYLFYQPKYNVSKDGLDGSEVLVRWYDAKAEGYISPAQFVPLFEKNGFVNKLDRYVFTHACEFLAQGVNSGLRVAPISVNVSRVTAMKSDFVSFYVATKNKYGIPNGFITLEFTETFSFTNIEMMRKIMTELHNNGFICSVDDFGVGYSSVLVLKELMMDELKLDMSLLRMSEKKERDKELLKMLVQLGKVYNMKVTQEGVETEEQLEFIKEIGCDVVQGYYYSKPLLAYDFQDFINSGGSMKAAREKITSSAYKQPKYIDFSVSGSKKKTESVKEENKDNNGAGVDAQGKQR